MKLSAKTIYRFITGNAFQILILHLLFLEYLYRQKGQVQYDYDQAIDNLETVAAHELEDVADEVYCGAMQMSWRT